MSLSLTRLLSSLSLHPSKSPSPSPPFLSSSQLPLPSKPCHTQSLVADFHVPSVCPSLSHANVLFFKSAYNVQIIVQDNEPEDRLLNRFRREVLKAGVIQECRRRRFFENKQEYKKRKARDAARRNRRRRLHKQSKPTKQSKQETSMKQREDDEENDNWDLPEVDLPYC